MATKRQQRWPLGTKIQKLFEGHGVFVGEVKSYKDGLYSIVYTDGDTEQLDEREMKLYALMDLPQTSTQVARRPTSPPRPAAAIAATTTTQPTAKRREVTAEESDDEDIDDSERQRRERVMRDIESMHQELEVTGFARSKSGHKKKTVPRHVSKIRTKKRKMLEKMDAAELAMLGEEGEEESDEEEESDGNEEDSVEGARGAGGKRRSRKKRLRGSKAAMEEDVLQESMVFQPPPAARGAKDDEQHEDNEDDDDDDGEGEEDLVDEDDSEPEEGQALPKKRPSKQNQKSAKKPSPRKKRNTSSQANSQAIKKRRRMYRLRNFQSFKMAQRHGDALAAHARGDHKTAIEKLKAVAKDAPSAPQVYSSLGMVYEDMLKESKERYYDRKASGDEGTMSLEAGPVTNPAAGEGLSGATPFIPNQYLREQCDLAKKAYGSHHVSAILCKKDFTLWVRAGESALEIAGVHEELLSFNGLSEELAKLHKAEKRRWQEEALRDFTVADNLKPPGIDVPAKLAAIHLDLGNLSDCLTILTDLKNRSRAEFHSSYKAWLLYSDLMLRLGHECIQWNQGLQSNENYMVRRWLRKYSKAFDWQERRVQALALALEAAAGTKSTEEFVNWLRNRTIEMEKLDEDEDEDTVPKEGRPMGGSEQDSKRESKPSEGQLLQEKDILSRKQENEIKEFDKTTEDMELVPNSDPSKDREAARNSLLETHKIAINTLEREFGNQEQATSNDADEPAEIVQVDRIILPITASLGTVCAIASDLMKQLHGLQLYRGARLVGEAVAKYMKERARRADRTINAKKRADEWQQKVDNSPFFLDPYHEGDMEDEDEDEIPYLSDEETLVDVANENSLLESLRRGVLPPELRVLLALAMIGEGGRNFIASKYLEAIHHLEQESESWLSDGDKEAELSGEPRWFLFKRAMGERVTKTIAFAFLSDVLKKSEKEAEWAVHFSPWFISHVKTLDEIGIIDQLLISNRSKITPNRSIRKNQILKVMLASCRLSIDTVEERDGVILVMGNKRPDLDSIQRLEIARSILEHLTQIIPLIWRVDRTGALSKDCVEVVSLSSKCFKWISENLPKDGDASLVESTLQNAQVIVSYFVGGSPIPDLEGLEESDAIKSFVEAARFPLSRTWQPSEFRPLSDRIYNIAASCNVPPFSGWENEKFTSRLLRGRCRNNDYWLHVVGKRITGCLSMEIESEMKRQFELFEELEPKVPKSQFVTKLKLVKESNWYKAKLRKAGGYPNLSEIACYGEEDMLELFLAFSGICLQVSQHEKDRKIARRREQLALSVLLPLCQFCLDESLWDAIPAPAPAPKLLPPAQPKKPTKVAPNRGKPKKTSVVSSKEKHQLEKSLVEASSFRRDDGKGNQEKRKKPEIGRDERSKVIEDEKVEDHEEEKDDFDQWRKEAGDTIFEPALDLLQTNWDNNEIRVLDGPGAIAAETMPASQPTESKRKQPKQAPKKQERRDITDTSMLKKFVPVPIRSLKKLWNRSFSRGFTVTAEAMNDARYKMQKVHSLMVDLRACFTLAAAEKQAAMYASQGSKAGNSDLCFRRNIPNVDDCTALEALVILGRADCLHSVYFPREAAFLCSFVARTCALHRDFFNSDQIWNDQWKVVGMYAHNVSVMIRTTVYCMIHHSNQNRQADFSSMWENAVVKELEKGMRDALEVLQSPTILEVDDEGKEEESNALEGSSDVQPEPENSTDLQVTPNQAGCVAQS